MKNKTYNKKKMLVVFSGAVLVIGALLGRLVYLMVFDAEYYQKRAEALHEREREIKAARGEIVDRNGMVLATNKTVCTISVIHSQIEEPRQVIAVLSKELEMEEEEVRKRVEKVSSMEKVKTNVAKEVGDRIRNYNLAGVKVDEDFKRYYPYNQLASKVLGFTGGDNQGIIGLEVKYEDVLKGTNGTILTVTDARGIELEGVAEDRIEPVAGNTLKVSLDYNIQSFCEQAAEKVMEEKQAEAVSLAAVGSFLYAYTVLFPSAEEGHDCVDRSRGVGVDGVEEVGTPGVGFVGALFKRNLVGIGAAAQFDAFLGHIGICEEHIADVQCHAQSLLGFGISPEALVFASGVSGVEVEFEFAPSFNFGGADGGSCHHCCCGNHGRACYC